MFSIMKYNSCFILMTKEFQLYAYHKAHALPFLQPTTFNSTASIFFNIDSGQYYSVIISAL